MFEVPVDALYVWIGVAAVSAAALGVVLALPTTTPPDATALAATADRIAVGPPGGHATERVDAAEIRLGPHRIALRNDGGAASASFAYGPMTPALTDDRLELVLHGHAVEDAFESEAAFAEAAEKAQTQGEWRPAPERVQIRHVRWGATDVVLVG